MVVAGRPKASTRNPGRPGRTTNFGPDRTTSILLLATAMCLVLRVLSSQSTHYWLWGLNTLHGWPPPWRWLTTALVLAAFTPAAAQLFGRHLERAGDWLTRPGLVPPLIVGALASLAIFMVRDTLRFTGDADTRDYLLPSAANLTARYPQIGPLDLLVNLEGVRALARAGLPISVAMRIVPALSGGALAAAMVGFVRCSGARGAMAGAAAAVLLGGGSLAHFPGYGKFGPLLFGIALAAIGFVRMARDGTGAGTLAVGTAVALLGHRSGFALLPGALLALVDSWRHAGVAQRAWIAGALGALMAVAASQLPHVFQTLVGYDLHRNWTGAHSPWAFDPLQQVGNLVNALSFLSPVWPVGIAAAFLPTREGAELAQNLRPAGVGSRSMRLAVAFGIGGPIALSLIARPVQGPPRDWDVLTGTALTVSFATAWALIATSRAADRVRLGVAVTAVTILAALAMWGSQFAPGLREDRLEVLLEDRSGWTRSELERAHEFLGARAFAAGRYDEAVKWYGRGVANSNSSRMLDNLAASEAMSGRLEDARRTLGRAMSRPQETAQMWIALLQVAYTVGDPARALACADSALKHDPANPYALAARAQMLREVRPAP